MDVLNIIEIIQCFPSIPLWMALAAAMPNDWTTIQVYFGITVILSLVGWTDLARVVRGRFLALREERAQRRDEETRARAMGCAIRVRAGAARRAGGARVSLEVKLV